MKQTVLERALNRLPLYYKVEIVVAALMFIVVTTALLAAAIHGNQQPLNIHYGH